MKSKRKKAWERLLEAYDKEQWVSARELAQQYLKKYPQDGFAWFILGKALTQFCLFKKAHKALIRSLENVPPEALRLPLNGLGHLDKKRARFKKAERWYKKSLEAEPNRPETLIFMGALFASQGRLAKAKKYYKLAIKTGLPECDEAHYNLGGICSVEGRLKAALKHYDAAIALEPDYRMAMWRRDDVLRAMALRETR